MNRPIDIILSKIQDATVPELMDSTTIPDEMMKALLQAIHLLIGQFDGAGQATALALTFGAVCAETEGGMVQVMAEEEGGQPTYFVPTFDEKVIILKAIASKSYASYLADLKRTAEESRLNAMPTSDQKM